MILKAVHFTYKAARRIVIAVVGTTVVIIGVLMIITPGPAIVVIPVGLAILSIEFTWARTWLRRLRESISNHGSSRRIRQRGAQQERNDD